MKIRHIAVMAVSVLALSACKIAADNPGAENPAFAKIDGEFLKTGGNGDDWAFPAQSYAETRHSPLGGKELKWTGGAR